MQPSPYLHQQQAKVNPLQVESRDRRGTCKPPGQSKVGLSPSPFSKL